MDEVKENVQEEEKKTIYTMDMHSSMEVAQNVGVFRVPGGWIYEFYSGGIGPASRVFVPKPVFKNKTAKPSSALDSDKDLEKFLRGEGNN